MTEPRGTVPTPSDRIDDLIATTSDSRAEVFRTLRRLIHEADPEVTEEWKWVTPRRPGTPVWEHAGMVCHINLLKGRIRLTLRHGAKLPDPHRLFDAALNGESHAIDIFEGDALDEDAMRALVQAGVNFNLATRKPRGRP